MKPGGIIISLLLAVSIGSAAFAVPLPEKSVAMGIISGPATIIGEIRDAITELKRVTDAVARFISTLSGIIRTIAAFAGLKAILLLLGALVISSLLVFAGIPRGVFSFFLSLFLADILWITWILSYSPGAPVDYLAIMRTNGVLLMPVVGLALVRKYFPAFFSRVFSAAFASAAGRLRRGRPLSPQELGVLLESYRRASGELQKSMVDDLVRSKGKKVYLSRDTRAALRETGRTIRQIELRQKAEGEPARSED